MTRGEFLAGTHMMPRYFCAGPVMLDLFHRDGNIDGSWLGLHPREFELLWILAENSGKRLSRQRLLSEIWRINHAIETNRVEVHVARVRAKLRHFGLDWLIATDPLGGYLLAIAASPAIDMEVGTPQQSLDSYARIGNDEHVRHKSGKANATPPE